MRPKKRSVSPFAYSLGCLWMIGAHAQIGEQQLLAARMRAPSVWFNGHEDGVDVFQRLRVVCLQHPALLAHVVFVENSQVPGLLLVRPSPAPSLKCARVAHP